MMFQLWDVQTGNMVGAYDSDTAALAVVWKLLSTHGPEYVETLALARVTRRGDTTTIALGHDLIKRAQAGAHAEQPPVARHPVRVPPTER